MIRRFSRKSGDNRPAVSLLELPTISGSGQVHVSIGWAPSAAIVSFSRLTSERYRELFSLDPAVTHPDPQIWVEYINPYTGSSDDAYTSTGFWLQYRNIPPYDGDGNLLGLVVNYMCES